VNLRIRLMKTKRTDVMCAVCQNFHADHVIVRTDGTETDTGVHSRCAEQVKAKFTRKRRSQPALPETGT
jgi:hypothetical protein